MKNVSDYNKDRILDLISQIENLLNTRSTSIVGSGLNININSTHLHALQEVFYEIDRQPNLQKSIIHPETIIISKDIPFYSKGHSNVFNVFTSESVADSLGYDEMLGLISSLTMPSKRPCMGYLKKK